MFVKHSCGCQVDVSPTFAPYVRKSLCDECRELAKKLQQEQHQRFEEAHKGI